MSIKGMDLRKAQRYLNDVIEKNQAAWHQISQVIGQVFRCDLQKICFQPPNRADFELRCSTQPSSTQQASAPERTAASSDGGWVVQVGSFGQADNASRLTAKLKEQGFAAYSQPRDNNLTTVYVGPFSSSDAGEKARSELKQAANIQGLLIRKPGS